MSGKRCKLLNSFGTGREKYRTFRVRRVCVPYGTILKGKRLETIVCVHDIHVNAGGIRIKVSFEEDIEEQYWVEHFDLWKFDQGPKLCANWLVRAVNERGEDYVIKLANAHRSKSFIRAIVPKNFIEDLVNKYYTNY